MSYAWKMVSCGTLRLRSWGVHCYLCENSGPLGSDHVANQCSSDRETEDALECFFPILWVKPIIVHVA